MKTRTVLVALAVLALAKMGNAQESVNGGMVVLGPLRSSGPQGLVDFTAAASTSPVKSGTLAARPGSCTAGQMYFATDAASGQNLSLCTSAGTWTTVAAGEVGVNKQTSTSYTLQDGDCGTLVTFSNGSAVGVSLPQAGASSQFAAGWNVDVQNRGAGTLTITPVASTIDGAASLTLTQNQGVRIFSDGANYFTQRGIGGAASSLRDLPMFLFDGGGLALTGTGTWCKVVSVPVTITKVYAIGDVSNGSAVIDVQTASLTNYLSTGTAALASITGGAPITISSAWGVSGPSIAAWSKAIAAETVVCLVPSGFVNFTKVAPTVQVQ